MIIAAWIVGPILALTLTFFGIRWWALRPDLKGIATDMARARLSERWSDNRIVSFSDWDHCRYRNCNARLRVGYKLCKHKYNYEAHQLIGYRGRTAAQVEELTKNLNARQLKKLQKEYQKAVELFVFRDRTMDSLARFSEGVLQVETRRKDAYAELDAA